MSGAIQKIESFRLDRSFFRQDPISVAKELLGQRLVRSVDGVRLAGTIVETEAYLGIEDRAAHSFGGRKTKRTQTMYADGGTAYVFLNYGIHHLLNVVTETEGVPTAVLLRAVQPTEGIDRMFSFRPTAKSPTQISSGPGKLGAAFAIDRSLDREDLVTSTRLFIERARTASIPKSMVIRAPRIGVAYAREWADRPLRFYLRDNAHVSLF